MSNNIKVYEKVTNSILSSLKKGVVPWRKPWATRTYDESNLHRNLVTKRAYRGINQFLCQVTAMEHGYQSPFWLSRKQIKAKGGRWSGPGTLITFWKPIPIQTDEIDKNGKKIVKTIPLLKYYYVWNLDQCEGIKDPTEQDTDEPEPTFNPIERAQAIIDGMPDAPTITHGGGRAYYSPSFDSVRLPEPEAFKAKTSEDFYYLTGYHELAHSTGHEKRLGRVKDWTTFGSDPYANEELVAEFTAAMLAGLVGLDATQESSAAYIANWSARFRADPKLLIKSASEAQKAADCILGVTWDNGDTEKAEVAHA